MPDLLFGIDLGTTGTKTTLYDADGRELAAAGAETAMRWRGPGEVDQDPEEFYGTATATMARCVAEAGADPASVAAIGVTGQMAGMLGIGPGWEVSIPYDSWLDTRCSADVAAVDQEAGDLVVDLTGCAPMVNHGPKMRWWGRERPEAVARTAAFVVPSAYVAGRLAGLDAGDAFVDRTYLHFTGVADARAGAWSSELTELFEVSPEKLPRIAEPTELVGRLSAEAASDAGLPAGVPVAAGLGDTAAGSLGAGIVRPGQLLDTAGTAAVFGICSDAPLPDTGSRTLIAMRSAIEGQWMSLAYLSGGGLLDWAARALGEAPPEGSPTDYEGLGAEATEAPAGADGLIFLPHLDGRLLPSDPELRGAWIGLDRRHGRPHLLRSVLESVAYEYSIYLEVMHGLYPELSPEAVTVIGGGAKSGIWSEIKASVLGLPYERPAREEFSCWGAALVAGAAVGLYDDLAKTATEAAPVTARWEADAGDAGAYREGASAYRAALEAVAGLTGRTGAIGATR